MTAPPYRFNYGLPGLFVEIYLPKKALYQGELYDTLTMGFDLDAVRHHFREHANDIKAFLRDNKEFGDYQETQVERLAPSYEGYSLYELDGVFCSRSTNKSFRSENHPRKDQLIEERVQVIRVMFLAPVDSLPGDPRSRAFAARRFLRFWTHDLDEYEADLRISGRPAEDVGLAKSLKGWLDDVGLFIHGYLLFKICQRIHLLDKAGSIENPEQEIWLSSFRSLGVVKTTLQDNYGG